METFYIVFIVIVVVGILVNDDTRHRRQLRKRQSECIHFHTTRHKNVFTCCDCGLQSEGPFKKNSEGKYGQ